MGETAPIAMNAKIGGSPEIMAVMAFSAIMAFG